jgi:periplasmic protein CpxP/Spy
MSEKRQNMIKSKADMFEKVYNILDSKQKEQFKVLIDLQSEKMYNRFN